MSLFDKVGLAMIPSGYKAGKVYSVVPNDAEGDFTFSRANGVQTRVNSSGYIESVADNVPRLNYPILLDGTVSSVPHLLLEPSRTNVVTRSEDFSVAWLSYPDPTNDIYDYNTTDTLSPRGDYTATKLTASTDNTTHATRRAFINTNSEDVTVSVFAKYNGCHLCISSVYGINSVGVGVVVNLLNGAVSSEASVGGAETSYSVNVEKYPNGWYRVSLSVSAQTGSYPNYITIGASKYDSSLSWVIGFKATSFAGNGVDGIYIWGAQAENSTYSTSYIPTSSTTATRQAEYCYGAGTSSDFGASGALFAEISTLNDLDTTTRCIALSDPTRLNRVEIRYNVNSRTIDFITRASGVTQSYISNATLNPYLLINKIAGKYGVNDNEFWINGFKWYEDNESLMISDLSKLDFNGGAGSINNLTFYGKTKQLIAFKKPLTDAELEELTSWKSLTQLATELEYILE